jgi:cyclopropane-fatty-acyl-phospholipid synthase
MTYSSALIRPRNDLRARRPPNIVRWPRTPALARKTHVLEIGCGWGGFAELPPREIGCRVTGLTISREQQILAKARIH